MYSDSHADTARGILNSFPRKDAQGFSDETWIGVAQTHAMLAILDELTALRATLDRHTGATDGQA